MHLPDMATWQGSCVVFGCPCRAAEGTTVCAQHQEGLKRANELLDAFLWKQKPSGEQARMF